MTRMAQLEGKIAVVTGGTQGLGAAIARVARAVAFLSSSESGLMTGAMVNYDQSVWGAFDAPPHPAAAL